MVKERLIATSNSLWDHADAVTRDIEKLKQRNLRKIKSEKAIRRICFEVITAVDTLILVHVNPDELEKRKIKKQKWIPLKYDDTILWNDSARIRNDWQTTRWQESSPHGWVYYNEDKSLLWTIYEGAESWNYEIFIRKDIAENPHGASILIWSMKKKLEKIMKKEG